MDAPLTETSTTAVEGQFGVDGTTMEVNKELAVDEFLL